MKAVIAIIFALIVVSNAGLLGSILQPVLDPVTRTLDSVTASGEAQVLLQSLQDNIKQVIDGGIGEILTNIDDDIDDLKAEWSQIFADRARLAQLVADTTHVVEVIYNAVNDPKTSPAGIRQFEAFREKITKAINARIQALASGIIQGIITLQCFRNEIPKIKQHSEEVVYQVQQVIGRVKALAQKAVEESIAAVQGLIDEFSACNGTSCQDDVVSDDCSWCSSYFLFLAAFQIPTHN